MKVIPKSYGSIPHLSTSKLTQQADKKISIGQELILTKKARDSKDLIIVTEKVDGSNVGILKKDGKLIALTRSGYTAESSPYKQHHYFADWVNRNRDKFVALPEGWRLCGEWCIVAHGTIYDLQNESPFLAFDIINDHNERLNYVEFAKYCLIKSIHTVKALHIGEPISVEESVKLLKCQPYGRTSEPEGVVYRCERNGSVDFLAKWVRSDKVDGKYLGGEDIWNKNAAALIGVV